MDVHEIKKEGEIRIFVIEDPYYATVKHYLSLRPKDPGTDRIFLQYLNGKCTRQPVGKNKFSQMPKTYAAFLDLDNVKKYTGHAFRRSSATLLADSGASTSMIMQHGGWKSPAIALSYVAQSVENKSKIFNRIADQCIPGTSNQVHSNDSQTMKRVLTEINGNCPRESSDNNNESFTPSKVPKLLDDINWDEPFDLEMPPNPDNDNIETYSSPATTQNIGALPNAERHGQKCTQTPSTLADPPHKLSTTDRHTTLDGNINTSHTIDNINARFFTITNCTIQNITINNIQSQNNNNAT